MATFVLVHGAFHGGWCWYKLATLLAERGHRVLAPDLPGHGRSAGKEATLEAYGQHVADVLNAEAEPAVLVGHRMGGAVITAAGELAPDKVAKIVYLTAFLAPNGGSMSGDLSRRPAPGGFIAVTPEAEPILYHDCPPEDVMLSRLCLTPQPQLPLTQPIMRTAERWGSIPRAFICCTLDRVFAIAGQRAQAEAEPGTEWLELPSGHSPFFSMPDKLADMLERLAA